MIYAGTMGALKESIFWPIKCQIKSGFQIRPDAGKHEIGNTSKTENNFKCGNRRVFH
jgi:hypothetical protein